MKKILNIIGIVLFTIFCFCLLYKAEKNYDKTVEMGKEMIYDSSCYKQCSKSKDNINVKNCALFCYAMIIEQDELIYDYLKEKDLLGWEMTLISSKDRQQSDNYKNIISMKKEGLEVVISLEKLYSSSLEYFFSGQKTIQDTSTYVPFVDLDPIDNEARYKTFIIPDVITTRFTIVDFPSGFIGISSCYNCQEEVSVFHNHLVEIMTELVSFSSDIMDQKLEERIKDFPKSFIDFKND